jgi:hypothetical protein
MTDELRCVSQGFSRKVKKYEKYDVNGYRFHTEFHQQELPGDVISCILRKLGHAELLLGGAAASCHSWRRAAQDDPSLWRRVDMRYLPIGYWPSRGREINFRGTVRAAVLLSAGQCDTFFGNYFMNDDLLLFLAEK